MSQRRSHAKSRLGCAACKKRRVKCDERDPVCSNCMKRQEPCNYPLQASSSSPQVIVLSQRSLQAPSPQPILLSAGSRQASRSPQSEAHASCSSRTRMLDLRLFHHYMTNTSMTFDIDDRFSDHWKDQIVKESLQHEFLMDSILSLSAFHVAYEEADVASVYVPHALEYQNRAFAAFNEALAKATRDNAGALFSFSMFMVICALVPSNKIGGQSTSDKLLSLSRYVRGTKAVAETFQDWLRDGSFGAFLNGRWSSILYSHPDLEDDLKHLRHLSNVLGLTEAVYEEPINRLEVAYARGKGSAIAWWAEIPDEFMDAIRRGDPLALLILMHWGALLHQLRHFWWVGNSGEMLVDELYQRLVDLGPVWRKSAEQVNNRLKNQETRC